MKKILFVCKYNIFRSKIAEMFFNRLNKDGKIKATSAGLINLGKKLPKNDISYLIAKRFGFHLDDKPRKINGKMLKEQDLIIIVASDVSKSSFNNKGIKDKLIFWNVKDETGKNKEKIIHIIKEIKMRVSKLYVSFH